MPTKKQLKGQLAAQGLSRRGKKADLIQRLAHAKIPEKRPASITCTSPETKFFDAIVVAGVDQFESRLNRLEQDHQELKADRRGLKAETEKLTAKVDDL